MGNSFEWMELEAVSRKIADAQGRLAAASSSKNYGLVRVLEQQIAEAEKRRSRLLALITTQITNSHEPARAADVSGSGTGQTTAPVKRTKDDAEPGSALGFPGQIGASPTPAPREAAEGMKIIEGDNNRGSKPVEHLEQAKVAEISMTSASSQISDATRHGTSV